MFQRIILLTNIRINAAWLNVHFLFSFQSPCAVNERVLHGALFHHPIHAAGQAFHQTFELHGEQLRR